MKVLVIGHGGREHAIVRSLRFSASVEEVHALPGSDGIALEAICHHGVSATDATAIARVANENQIQLIVVGPEVPLAAGVCDQLRAQGLAVFGPNRQGANLESSKIFSKNFMVAAGVPTADFHVVSTVEETLQAASHYSPPYVLKADGLAAGKGVFICEDLEQLRQNAHRIFVEHTLGEAGQRALLERFEAGYELSYLVLTNGSDYRRLPLSQDHKRLLDGDRGPNTGGMGVVAAVGIPEVLEAQIQGRILGPVMTQMMREQMVYRGLLYVGIMVTSEGPKVIEFNARFGDPEAQAILPLVSGDWGQIFWDVSQGKLPELKFQTLFTTCLVMAAAGYPEHPVKDALISGDINFASPSSYFLHAGTALKDGRWVTAGGRVLNAVGIGSTLKEARQKAYLQAEKVSWNGLQLRHDIGSSLLHSQN